MYIVLLGATGFVGSVLFKDALDRGHTVTAVARDLGRPQQQERVKPGSLATTNAWEQLRNEPSLEWSFLAPSAEMGSGERPGEFRLGSHVHPMRRI